MRVILNIIVIILIFGQNVSAQKSLGFYIEPSISTKLHTYNKGNLPPDIVTEYFIIKPRQYIFTLGTGASIGLNLGYKFKNNDKIHIGFFHDEVTQGIYAYGNSVNSFTPDIVIGRSIYKEYGGTSCTNFNLMYKRAILEFKNNWVQSNRTLLIHVNFGLTYLYKPDNGLENLTGTSGLSWTAPDSSRVTVQVTRWNAPQLFKNSFKGIFGLDFTFNKNQREFFTFNISFITGRSGMNGSSFGYSSISAVVTKNNKTITYATRINGTGNGIHFTLSKRIYPFKYIQDRRQKKLEKFNYSQLKT